jgi:hypothetical protein
MIIPEREEITGGCGILHDEEFYKEFYLLGYNA